MHCGACGSGCGQLARRGSSQTISDNVACVKVPVLFSPIVTDVALVTVAEPGPVIGTRCSGTLYSGSVSLAKRLTV